MIKSQKSINFCTNLSSKEKKFFNIINAKENPSQVSNDKTSKEKPKNIKKDSRTQLNKISTRNVKEKLPSTEASLSTSCSSLVSEKVANTLTNINNGNNINNDNVKKEQPKKTIHTINKNIIKNKLQIEFSYFRNKILLTGKEIIEDDKFIKKFVLLSQERLNKEFSVYANLPFFQDKLEKLFEFVGNFQFIMCNFLLIMRFYSLDEYYREEELQLFLLIFQQNEKIFDTVFRKINTQLSKNYNAKKNAKFLQGSIMIFMQILSVFIKLSAKFYKTNQLNYFLRLYTKIISLISFKAKDIFHFNNETETNEIDIKDKARYLYRDCLYNISIFFFYKYSPLILSNIVLKHILSLYENFDGELLNVEQILLIAVNYNYGLLSHIDGNSIEAVFHLKKASQKIYNLNYTETKTAENPLNKKNILLNKKISGPKNRKSSYPRSPKHYKILKKKSLQFSKIEKITKNQMEFTLNLQQISPEENLGEENNIINNTSRIMRKKSIITLNDKKICFLHDPVEFSSDKNQEYIKEQLLNKIEILLADIELDQKNYQSAYTRLNDIISKNNNNRLSLRKNSTLNNFDIKMLNNSPTPSTSKNTNTTYNRSRSRTNLSFRKKNTNLISKMLAPEDIYDIMKLFEKAKKENTKNDEQDDNENEIQINNVRKKSLREMRYVKNISDQIEKFFIFICSLSVYQLNLLNKSQTNLGNKRNDLPILFSNQFKDCISNSQRQTLDNMEAMNLTRYLILINPDKDICPENIDFHSLYFKLNEKNNSNKKFEKSRNLRNTSCKKLNTKYKTNVDYSWNIIIGDHRNNSFSSEENKNCEITDDEFQKENNSAKYLYEKFKKKYAVNEDAKELINKNKRRIMKFFENLRSEQKKLMIESPECMNVLLNELKSYEINDEDDNE